MSSHDLFLGSEYAQQPRHTARFHVIPVPYEYTVSYGAGTANGPQAILTASDQLEVFDGTSSPGDNGIHTEPPLDCAGGPSAVFPRISTAVATAVREGPDGGGIPIILGGEHSITAPAVRGVQEVLHEPIGVVQIDAHADLRDQYEGTRESHATVARRIHQDLGLSLVQIGVRALSPEEVSYRADGASRAGQRSTYPTITTYDAVSIVPSGVSAISLPESFPQRIYLTIDVDGLDPSVIAATGTPVPGGLGWYQLLSILESIAATREIVACDVVELAPIPGHHGWDYTAAELVYRTMGIIARSPACRKPHGT
ncbi:MAG TPA: agmatinase family protein [Alkalispirochaeta sp.]|nr:agmatinase family protein [Alkalispirochaeta sp.]